MNNTPGTTTEPSIRKVAFPSASVNAPSTHNPVHGHNVSFRVVACSTVYVPGSSRTGMNEGETSAPFTVRDELVGTVRLAVGGDVVRVTTTA